MTAMLRHIHLLLLLITAAGLTGCTVGPNYKRPAVDVPVTYRGSTTEEQAAPAPASTQTPVAKPEPAFSSLGDEKWWEVFQDKELQGLIRTALKNNYDVRIAATRVLQAQAQLGITRFLVTKSHREN
jgi:multidrug efflux system outer membrane protein